MGAHEPFFGRWRERNSTTSLLPEKIASSPTTFIWTGRLNTHWRGLHCRSAISELCLQILPAHLVPPHAASPAIHLFFFLSTKVPAILLEWSGDLGTMSWDAMLLLVTVQLSICYHACQHGGAAANWLSERNVAHINGVPCPAQIENSISSHEVCKCGEKCSDQLLIYCTSWVSTCVCLILKWTHRSWGHGMCASAVGLRQMNSIFCAHTIVTLLTCSRKKN